MCTFCVKKVKVNSFKHRPVSIENATQTVRCKLTAPGLGVHSQRKSYKISHETCAFHSYPMMSKFSCSQVYRASISSQYDWVIIQANDPGSPTIMTEMSRCCIAQLYVIVLVEVFCKELSPETRSFCSMSVEFIFTLWQLTNEMVTLPEFKYFSDHMRLWEGCPLPLRRDSFSLKRPAYIKPAIPDEGKIAYLKKCWTLLTQQV